MITDIDERTGWPDELKTLLNQHPRDSWRRKGNPTTEFWLEKHDYFRLQAKAMSDRAMDFREDRYTPVEFAQWIAPRLQQFLGALHGHHQIEDHHYFPAFRAAEKSLASGFDVLASDHELMHQSIADIIDKTNTFLGTLQDDSQAGRDAQKVAAELYIETSEKTFRRLTRHLSDEEDLIIPIMLGHR